MFESCYKNKAVQCLLLGLPDRVIYDDDLSKPTMIVNAQQKVLLSQPNKLYKKRLGIRDIKAVGLRENHAELIDNKYHKEMCPMPPLKVWIKGKNYYPIGTRIEREFTNDSGLIYDATITDIDLETKQYILKWDHKNKYTEKEDNYTGC